MAPSLDLWELRVGVYATDGEMRLLISRAKGALECKVSSWCGDGFSADAPAEPGIEHDDPEPMTVEQLYSELPPQWRIEHPDLAPDGRAVFELRAGVLAAEDSAEQLLDDLTHLMCPDPMHSGPCPIPWSASTLGAVDNTYRDYLEHCYGQLRHRDISQA